MKIGDEVYAHGYIDEIRNDVIIIRNEGGYFGTVPSEVVEKEETLKNLKKPNKSDLISRQAAIDAFDGVKVDEKTEYDIGYNDGIDLAVSKLSVLPSATSQSLTKPNKSDLIVKGAGEIKDGLYNIKDGKLFKYKANGGTVRTYPIVSADRPTGHWTEKEVFDNQDSEVIDCYQSARCSHCGKYHTTPYSYYFDNYNFCPNCGADMRGGDTK